MVAYLYLYSTISDSFIGLFARANEYGKKKRTRVQRVVKNCALYIYAVNWNCKIQSEVKSCLLDVEKNYFEKTLTGFVWITHVMSTMCVSVYIWCSNWHLFKYAYGPISNNASCRLFIHCRFCFVWFYFAIVTFSNCWWRFIVMPRWGCWWTTFVFRRKFVWLVNMAKGIPVRVNFIFVVVVVVVLMLMMFVVVVVVVVDGTFWLLQCWFYSRYVWYWQQQKTFIQNNATNIEHNKREITWK